MQRVLGAEAGQLYCGLHAKNGVDIRLNAIVKEIRGDGQCRAVVLDDGTELAADVVVYGVGAAATSELAEAAGIAVANGIVVDAQCRTSIEGIWACGDVATRPSSFAPGNIRLESWQNAYRQGVAAVKSMLGSDEPFDDLPWFWTDQYDVKMQLAGLPSPTDTVVWRGNPAAFDCTAFYVSGGLLKAVVGMNRPRDVRPAMDLIRNRIPVDPAQLADESVNLRALGK
jgi:3-phenylpropionate/trans-cinnamate dioxygenase ferredoxin reductase component